MVLIRASGGRFETRWGGLGGSPVAHRTIKGSIKSIESGRQLVDSWRGSRRPLRQNFFCAEHRVGCAGPPPREKLVSKTLGRPGCLRLARSGKSPRLVAKELRSFFFFRLAQLRPPRGVSWPLESIKLPSRKDHISDSHSDHLPTRHVVAQVHSLFEHSCLYG